MEINTEIIYETLASDDTERLESFIDNVLKTSVHSNDDCNMLVAVLQKACVESYQKHWLKTHNIILSLFKMPELLGVDCMLFDELRSIDKPGSMKEASDSLFDVLIEVVRNQFNDGGSTLFFDIARVSSTRSAIIASDLIKARYRETILVLNEIDDKIPTLTKEWVDVSRLWRTGNGFRLLKARNLGIHIHVKEYLEIRDLLVNEMQVNTEKVVEDCQKLREGSASGYLKLSKTLDEFISGLIASRGIRGSFDPYYKTWINHEGLDEF
jgi:hypothetical protein